MTVSHKALAERLRTAYAMGAVAPLRDGLNPDDVDGAYAVQAVNTRFWLDSGRRIVGRKIGLTSKAVQTQLGVDQPDFGVLFADMEVANGGMLAAGAVLQPKAEAEIALLLSRDVTDTDATVETMMTAADCAMAAIEIVDSRIANWEISFADTVADNGSSAFFVRGDPVRLRDLDLYTCGMVMEINGKVASLGAGAACLGHPLNAAAWLARTLARRGEPLRAGDILLTGALGPMVALRSGDEVIAHVGGVGSAGFRFAGDADGNIQIPSPARAFSGPI